MHALGAERTAVPDACIGRVQAKQPRMVVKEYATACLTEVASIQAVRSRKYCVSVRSPLGISAAADAICERTRSVERVGSSSQGHAERVQSSRGRKRTRLPGQSSALGACSMRKRVDAASLVVEARQGLKSRRWSLFGWTAS